jgi:hypothetical protein
MLAQFISSNREVLTYFWIIIFLLIVAGLSISFIYKNYVLSFILILVAASSASFYYGVYSYAYKTFPFNSFRSKSTIEKKSNLNTAYHELIISKYNLPKLSKYGGIDFINNQLVYLSGSKEMYVLDKNDKGIYNFREIKIEKIPNNHKKFIKKHTKDVGKFDTEDLFGVKDILVSNFSNFDNKLLLASSNYYDEKNDCYNISIYLNEIIDENNYKFSNWKKIFATKNCLSVNLTPYRKFAGASAGGRIVKFDNDHILLSVGDFLADGVNGPILSQDLSNDYGKILKININNSSYKIFSIGHRNPQGLFIDKNKNIFSTEHGPLGGDELNLILEGKNYGWPVATFGMPYSGKKKWPLDQTNNTHDGFEKPIYAWGPTFGISNLIVYDSDYFFKWKGNLLISSLVAQSLVRMIFDEKKKSVIYYENIKIGNRIRDIIQSPDGRIVLLTDTIMREKDSELIFLAK